MRLTTKGRYAVTALLDLALHSESGPVSLAEIAKRQELSLSYLEQLFVKLRRNKLVASSRGPGGGYSFDRDLATVSVADINEAVDEVVDATNCSGKSDCHQENRSKALPFYFNIIISSFSWDFDQLCSPISL